MALEVRFSWETIKAYPPRIRTVVDSYYVRTPNAVFLKEKYTNHLDPKADYSRSLIDNHTTVELYDRNTGQYRETSKFDSCPTTEGKVTYETWTLLSSMTSVESVVDFFGNTSLYHLAEHGSVTGKKQIDGHDCWGIAYDEDPGIQGHVIWVDPKIGSCPRRVDLVIKNKIRRTKTMRGYHEIDKGIWFPQEVVYRTYSKTGALKTTAKITVTSAKLVPIDRTAKLKVEFPPDTILDDDRPRLLRILKPVRR